MGVWVWVFGYRSGQVEFQRLEKGQVGENGGQLDENRFEIDISDGRCSGWMRGSGVILRPIGMSGVVVCEPLYGQGPDVLGEVGSFEDGPAPAPRPVGSAILGASQLDNLLYGHGCIEQQLRKGAESVGNQQRLLQGQGW